MNQHVHVHTFRLGNGCGRGSPATEPLHIDVPQARYNQANRLGLNWADLRRYS